MAAISKHKYDVSEWLYKVINSCTTIPQYMSAKKLIRNYQRQYPYKEIYDDMHILHQCLLDWWEIKFDNLLKTGK